MTRYFIGLMLPPNVQQHVQGFTASLAAKVSHDRQHVATWNAPADLHCTLLYIGQFDDAPQLSQRMSDVARQLAPFDVTISGATHWLGRNSLALAATGADTAGTTFVEQLGQLSSDARAGHRRFYGHVTLGRVKPVPAPEADSFRGHVIEPITWTVNDVQLVRSAPASDGTRYQVVASCGFQ